MVSNSWHATQLTKLNRQVKLHVQVRQSVASAQKSQRVRPGASRFHSWVEGFTVVCPSIASEISGDNFWKDIKIQVINIHKRWNFGAPVKMTFRLAHHTCSCSLPRGKVQNWFPLHLVRVQHRLCPSRYPTLFFASSRHPAQRNVSIPIPPACSCQNEIDVNVTGRLHENGSNILCTAFEQKEIYGNRKNIERQLGKSQPKGFLD